MGSYHVTCAISNLYITPGTEVAVFFMSQTEFNRNYVYSHDCFKPCLLPFYATYADYGDFEDYSGAGLPILLEAIKNNLTEIEAKSEYDAAVRKDNFNVDRLFSINHAGKLYICGKRDMDWWQTYLEREKGGISCLELAKTIVANANVGLKGEIIVIHKKIFDYIVDNYKLELSKWSRKKGVTYKDIISHVPDFILRVQNKLKEYDKFEPELKECLSKSSITHLFPWNDENLAAKHLALEHELNFSPVLSINDTIIKSINDPVLPEILKEVLKGSVIDYFMVLTRRAWIRPIGEGSQNEEPQGYRVLNKAINKVLDEK